jgi:hypothetical protein
MRLVFAFGFLGAACAGSGHTEPSAGNDASAMGSSDSTNDGATQTTGLPDSSVSDAPGVVTNEGSTVSDARVTDESGSALCLDAGSSSLTYDEQVLCDRPVVFLAMNGTAGSEPDLTGHGNAGAYQGGQPASATLPNGDSCADFNGSSQYLKVPSSATFSIPTTGSLTWEGWIEPDVLQFAHESDGYVDWMGKCASYSPTCEWEARMYDSTNSQGRCNRMSAYVFNPSAGLGSAADWQPTCGLVSAGQWYHVVGEYTTLGQPADCTGTSMYPGSIDIWVNGVKWDQATHNPTGCMSQYSVIPEANASPINVGTMALDTWFPGAVGKVAIYGYLLSATQIAAHYRAMTGQSPAGSCADMCSL